MSPSRSSAKVGISAAGRVTVTARPPAALSRSRSDPRDASTSVWAIGSPSPEPGLESSNRQNRSSARAFSSSLRPGPSSATVKRGGCRPAVTVTETRAPGGDAAIALSMRLSRTCSTPLGTALTTSGAARRCEIQGDVGDVGAGRPGIDAIAGKLHEIDGLRRRRLFGSGELEEIVDEAGQPVGLFDGGAEIVGAVGRGPVALQVLEAQPKRGERRAKLMRGVGHE